MFQHIADPKARESARVLAPAFNADGLVTCVVTDEADGAVLMLAHMNAEALALTLETGIAHFWSRSRKTLWKKGETSGNTISVVEMRIDCDQDALWIKGRIAGDALACHTGQRTCFYRKVTERNGEFTLVADG